ncbi:hypothetical protein VV11_023160 [Trichodesmium erythraeum 21-75]|nr:hypothetical protein [Trichodesmium erythraeum 21-75]
MGLISNNSIIESYQGSNWIEGKYKFSAEPHPTASLVLADRRKEESSSADFDFDLMTIPREYPYQAFKVCPPNSENLLLSLWVVYIPVDKKQKINHSF